MQCPFPNVAFVIAAVGCCPSTVVPTACYSSVKELDHSVPDRYPNFCSIWNQKFVLCRVIRSITNYWIMPSKYPNSRILDTPTVVGRQSADCRPTSADYRPTVGRPRPTVYRGRPTVCRGRPTIGRLSADTTKKYCKPVSSDRRPSQTIRYEVCVMPAHYRAC